MNRLAIPILTLLFLVPGSLSAQYSGYSNPYGYTNPYNVNPYNAGPSARPAISPYVGLLQNRGPNSGVYNYTQITQPQQRNLANDLYYHQQFQNLGIGPAPPGIIEGDLYAILPPAGHLSGFQNTFGYYPLSQGTTTNARTQPPASKKQ